MIVKCDTHNVTSLWEQGFSIWVLTVNLSFLPVMIRELKGLCYQPYFDCLVRPEGQTSQQYNVPSGFSLDFLMILELLGHCYQPYFDCVGRVSDKLHSSITHLQAGFLAGPVTHSSHWPYGWVCKFFTFMESCWWLVSWKFWLWNFSYDVGLEDDLTITVVIWCMLLKFINDTK